MKNNAIQYISRVLENMPSDWLNLTTHRLDIYIEKLAKTQFIEKFEELFTHNDLSIDSLKNLPTAYDYIRLGHPLSCILEWTIAKINQIKTDNVISFSSITIPILSILRKNLFLEKQTRIYYIDGLPSIFDEETIKKVYNYQFSLHKINSIDEITPYNGSSVFINKDVNISNFENPDVIDFIINTNEKVGSVLLINSEDKESYINEIQHVRRRETISMTPENCFATLKSIVQNSAIETTVYNNQKNKELVENSIKKITHTTSKPLIGSSGLSIQYAIMMGLIDQAIENHPGKAIKFIVPPNCYGGTNDQARRVAACHNKVEIVDLPVDDGQDMVKSVELVLNQLAKEDAIPFIIAEIPTNPRVEVPDLLNLKETLSIERKTPEGDLAIEPVFILDQTFCPNVNFLGDNAYLSSVRSISYASGSKFPSAGKCTAGYCAVNKKGIELIEKIEKHLILCDNQATNLQLHFLAEQLPSMNERIHKAYLNTREFVSFIEKTLPNSNINFVSEELANYGFTPSVFSLDLPTKGNSDEEREMYKRELNLKLINMMINEIPNESKYCVSYGQLKGCYWTIPATSTQGTTKEGDKDYIARVSVSPNLDLEHHKKVFTDFVNQI